MDSQITENTVETEQIGVENDMNEDSVETAMS